MTRSEARMVAEEFYKLMRRDERFRSLETGKSYSKEWIGSKAAADMLDCTKKTLYSHIDKCHGFMHLVLCGFCVRQAH
jgi:hypothetical protein